MSCAKKLRSASNEPAQLGRQEVTELDLPIVLLQIGLPIGLLAFLVLNPARSASGYAVQLLATGLAILAVSLASIWTVPPWWLPIGYGSAWIVAVVYRLLARHPRVDTRLPNSFAQWVLLFSFAALGFYGVIVSAEALKGRVRPDADFVSIPMPLGPGAYLVANGGSTEAVNAHFLTLEPSTDRQRAYRGQSFAVDLVKIDHLGMRATGWRPREPEDYLIFGESVFAPCDGIVEAAADDMPDMQVPEPDTTRLEGNHVFLNCGEYGILLAHLQSGSVTVVAGDEVETGQSVGRVGNSGQTFEPHLHIHAQRLAEDGSTLSGEPLHLVLDGVFPVRNMRLKGLR